MPTYAKSNTELAEKLGISRNTLQSTWVKREGFPPKGKMGYNVEKVADWIREYKEAQIANQSGDNADLKRKKLELECEKLEVNISILKGDFISMDEHLSEMAQLASVVNGVFKMLMEGAKAMGIGASLIKELKRLIERCLATLRADIEELGEDEPEGDE